MDGLMTSVLALVAVLGDGWAAVPENESEELTERTIFVVAYKDQGLQFRMTAGFAAHLPDPAKPLLAKALNEAAGAGVGCEVEVDCKAVQGLGADGEPTGEQVWGVRLRRAAPDASVSAAVDPAKLLLGMLVMAQQEWTHEEVGMTVAAPTVDPVDFPEGETGQELEQRLQALPALEGVAVTAFGGEVRLVGATPEQVQAAMEAAGDLWAEWDFTTDTAEATASTQPVDRYVFGELQVVLQHRLLQWMGMDATAIGCVASCLAGMAAGGTKGLWMLTASRHGEFTVCYPLPDAELVDALDLLAGRVTLTEAQASRLYALAGGAPEDGDHRSVDDVLTALEARAVPEATQSF